VKASSKGSATPIAPALSPDVGAGEGRTDSENPNFGLTVRIEINLPATGDQETYDKIFKSI
jgi:hypothetical protein